MEDFITSSRRAVLSGSGPGSGLVHVVLGNEACDLDSMVCALVYAYFLHKTLSGEVLVVPVLNIPEADFVLRSDAMFLLRETGLTPHQVLFRDQLDLRGLHRERRLRLTLVDHNVLPDSDSDLEGAVVEVIDHHRLERVVTEMDTSCPITIETVGSCATLVTERILQRAPQILDSQIATLLYGTILVDCVDLAPEAGKVTPKDSEVVLQLETEVQTLPQRSQLFTALNRAKFNVSGLNTEQMLIKDLKSVSGPDLNLGISVLYLPLQVSLYLEQAQNPALDLQPISSPYPHITAFHQGNSVVSRKKLLPLVKDFLWSRHGDDDDDMAVPPTPVNSLVEGCPLDQGPPSISPVDLQTRLNQD